MAEIIVRNRNGGQAQEPASIAPREWDPMRRFRDLMSWDPFAELAPMWRDGSRAFDPDFEVKETKDAYLFKADVPGVREEDLEVNVTGSRINITGRREEEREEQTDTYYACERSYGTFARSFTLPEGADFDHMQAELRAGVLTVVVPKRAEVQPRRIPVKGEPKQKA